MGESARQLVARRFGFDAAVKSYLRLYDSLLGSNASN
jgi:hypothetical protein